jgi:hypothetical protein
MGSTVQARLDEKTQAILTHLVKRGGLKTSDVLRRGIHLVAREAELGPAARIVGIGEFDFGPTDRATNKKALQQMGRSSIRGGKPRRASR